MAVVLPLVLVFIFSQLMTNTDAANCSAPSVCEGEPASITCDFQRDVRTLIPVSMNVEFYPDNAKEVEVFKCEWMNKDSEPSCRTSKGYTFTGDIGTTLQLGIQSASENQTGRYACKVMSKSFNPQPDPCKFDLILYCIAPPIPPNVTTEKREDTENSQEPGIIAAIVVGIAAVAVASVLLFLWCRRKKSRPGNVSQLSQREPMLPAEERNPSSNPKTESKKDDMTAADGKGKIPGETPEDNDSSPKNDPSNPPPCSTDTSSDKQHAAGPNADDLKQNTEPDITTSPRRQDSSEITPITVDTGSDDEDENQAKSDSQAEADKKKRKTTDEEDASNETASAGGEVTGAANKDSELPTELDSGNDPPQAPAGLNPTNHSLW